MNVAKEHVMLFPPAAGIPGVSVSERLGNANVMLTSAARGPWAHAFLSKVMYVANCPHINTVLRSEIVTHVTMNNAAFGMDQRVD